MTYMSNTARRCNAHAPNAQRQRAAVSATPDTGCPAAAVD